jgi:hypothetical protein
MIEHALLKEKRVRALFEGKTIERLHAPAVNAATFFFTDGSSVSIETDAFGNGLVGMVACEKCVERQFGETFVVGNATHELIIMQRMTTRDWERVHHLNYLLAPGGELFTTGFDEVAKAYRDCGYEAQVRARSSKSESGSTGKG